MIGSLVGFELELLRVADMPSIAQEISATAFTVVGVATKMASVLMNEFIEPEKNLLKLAAVGVCVVCSALYRQSPLRATNPSQLNTV